MSKNYKYFKTQAFYSRKHDLLWSCEAWFALKCRLWRVGLIPPPQYLYEWLKPRAFSWFLLQILWAKSLLYLASYTVQRKTKSDPNQL